MPHQRVNRFLRSAARSMRSEPIDVEEALWWRLRGRRLAGLKFRRQHPIGQFITDFVCLEARLVVELDGKQHEERTAADEVRTAVLRRLGFEVIRFANDVVRIDIDGVCEAVLDAAGARRSTPHPTAPRPPSPARGEG